MQSMAYLGYVQTNTRVGVECMQSSLTHSNGGCEKSQGEKGYHFTGRRYPLSTTKIGW